MAIFHLEFQPPVNMTGVQTTEQFSAAIQQTEGLVINRIRLPLGSHRINHPEMTTSIDVEATVLRDNHALLRIKALDETVDTKKDQLSYEVGGIIEVAPVTPGGSITTIDRAFPMGFIIAEKEGDHSGAQYLFAGIEYRK